MSSIILETKASRFYWRSTGYKGKDHHPEDVQVYLSNKSRKKMTRWERMWMNRRSAIEPVISHLKHDHNMIRNFLKGKEGDRINAILSAAGFNFSKLIRAFFCYFENSYLFIVFIFNLILVSFHFVKNLNFSGTTN
ncbi:transposase DDE domain protein [Leptospira borgpetersenii str. UI 09149]|nr:transposase DDE domain protein [Leptospira borgpetersenii str. UI 09149]